MQSALLSRMQESLIIKFPSEYIVPRELRTTCVFLMMLQHLISCSAPDVPIAMQLSQVELLSTNEQNVIEQVTEFDSL
jgi:hypothetical protein